MNEESRLQFERYLQLINRRKFVLAIPIILAVVGAALLSYFSPRVYEASATARVNLSESGIDTQDPNSADRFLNTYSAIIKTSPFLQRVIEDLNLDTTTGSLAGRVGTQPIPGTELVNVTARASKPDEAAAIANDLTNLLKDPLFISQFLTNSTDILTRQVEATRQNLDDEQAKLGNLQGTGASASQIASQQAIVEATQNAYQSLLAQLESARVKQGQASRAFSVIEPAGVAGSAH